jgi:CHAT domain-containing protein/tetratricopeptide (TPR) repeat protein
MGMATAIFFTVALPSIAQDPGFSGKSTEAIRDEALGKFLAGNVRQSIPWIKELLDRLEKTHGRDHHDVAVALEFLGRAYLRVGEIPLAEETLKKCLALREELLRPDSESSPTLLVEGAILDERLSIGKGVQVTEREIAQALYHLGSVYAAKAEFAEAEPLLARAWKIAENRFLRHPDAAKIVTDLGFVHYRLKRYDSALELLQRGLDLRPKDEGVTAQGDVARSKYNLGLVYKAKGDIPRAKRLFQEVLAFLEKQYKSAVDMLPETAEVLSQLADVSEHTGDMAQANAYRERANRIQAGTERRKERLESDPEDIQAMRLQSLPAMEAALAFHERTLGPAHPDTMLSILSIAQLYRQVKKFDEAAKLLDRAINAYQVKHPDADTFTACLLRDRAEMYEATGNVARAAELRKRAKAIAKERPDSDGIGELPHDNALAYVFNRGDGSVVLVRKLIGAFFRDSPKELREVTQRYEKAQKERLSVSLLHGSDSERLSFSFAEDSLYACYAKLKDTESIARVALQTKGVVLDSMLEDRQLVASTSDPEIRSLAADLLKVRQELAGLLLTKQNSHDGATTGLDARLKASHQRMQELEFQLVERLGGIGRTRRALTTALADVQASLPVNAALVEFVRFSPMQPDTVAGGMVWYGAVIISTKERPRWVVLGGEDDIELEINRYQKSARGQTNEETLHATLRKLHDKIWAPIAAQLPAGSKTVIVCPEGDINFVSFATLLDSKDRFAAERYSFRYVASGRDLLRPQNAEISRDAVIMADPIFDEPAPAANISAVAPSFPFRSSEKAEVQKLFLVRLKGAAAEADKLAEILHEAKWNVHCVTENAATESTLQSVRSPGILHLATHGFVLREPNDSQSRSMKSLRERAAVQDPDASFFFDNPMRRSVLALAGAQRTLDAWNRGQTPPAANDGILTAEEVSFLQLDGCWLVTMSACDTGSGEVHSGEGVFGLRRGFTQAGAQNLLITLWPIGDVTTVAIMADFYKRALAGGDAAVALADTQRDWLLKVRRESGPERGLTEAVRLAGGFILNGQGKMH